MFARRSLTLLLVLSAALLVVAPALAGGKPGGGPAAAPPTDQIVIRMASGKSLDTTSLDSTAGIDLTQLRQRADGTYVLKLPKRHDADAVKAITDKLAARGDVVSVEPDAMMEPLAGPRATRAGLSSGTCSIRPRGNYGINLLPAWDITTGSSAITIGVIDTGYRPHIDLTGRFTAGYDFINDALVANDGNGRDSDPSDPGDWVTSAENASGYFAGCGASNSSWHGTHVAGTIGAVANNVTGLSANVVGINQVSKIQPLRVLGKCGGYTSDIADAIRWAAGLTVTGVPANPTPDRVVNISLGGSGACDSTTQSAITAAVNAGTVVVVAAGNSNADAANFTPANCNGVVTVAATGNTGKRAYYSNYGTSVEIAAPGGDAQLGKTILSTLNAGTQGPGADSYANYQGTSMATPHVVGVVSLMLSAKPTLTPAQVTTMLQATATQFPAGSTCTTSTCGAGIVNAGAAVAAANGGGGGGLPAPGAFDKTAPANLASIAGTSTTLTWGTSTNAASYDYCVDTVNNAACDTSWVSTATATSAPLSGLTAGTTYYWQVRATNATGTDARERQFLVDVLDPGSAAPAGRVLEDLAGERRHEPEAVAVAEVGEEHERDLVRVVPLDVFDNLYVVDATTALSASVSGLASRVTYYWQVRANNAAGHDVRERQLLGALELQNEVTGMGEAVARPPRGRLSR